MAPEEKPVDFLFQQLESLFPADAYPENVLRIPDVTAGRPRLPGIAFFPGGSGLWMPDFVSQRTDFPVGGVMILGHDFDSEAAYHNSLQLMDLGPCDPCSRNR